MAPPGGIWMASAGYHVILVVKKIYGKMSARRRQASCIPATPAITTRCFFCFFKTLFVSLEFANMVCKKIRWQEVSKVDLGM